MTMCFSLLVPRKQRMYRNGISPVSALSWARVRAGLYGVGDDCQLEQKHCIVISDIGCRVTEGKTTDMVTYTHPLWPSPRYSRNSFNNYGGLLVEYCLHSFTKNRTTKKTWKLSPIHDSSRQHESLESPRYAQGANISERRKTCVGEKTLKNFTFSYIVLDHSSDISACKLWIKL